MQRSKWEAVTDSLLGRVVHDDGSRKRVAAVQHPVAHGANLIGALDYAELRILQDLEHQLGSGFMVRNFLGNLGLFVSGAVLQSAAFDTDPLDQALGQLFLAVHVDQLIFQRGRTRVYNQNFHNLSYSFFYLTTKLYYTPDLLENKPLKCYYSL